MTKPPNADKSIEERADEWMKPFPKDLYPWGAVKEAYLAGASSMQGENERLRSALEFYADYQTWHRDKRYAHFSRVGNDTGDIARTALARYRGETK